jgi:hypothetical protein
MFSRFKSAARILLMGDLKKKKRNPIPAITVEEVAEIKQFFPREKFFIFGHARSGTTLLMRLVRLHPEVHCNYAITRRISSHASHCSSHWWIHPKRRNG